MKFLTFFILAAALVAAVCAQDQPSNGARQTYDVINKSSQQNVDDNIFVNATLALKDGFTRGTNPIATSENTMNNAISEAKKSLDDPEAAKEIMTKAFGLANKQISQAVPVYFQSFGDALGLSNNDGAIKGLRSASVILQKAGFSILDQIQIAQNLFNVGIEAKDNAAEALIEAIRLTVHAGYTGFYHNAQESIKTAVKALRDARQAGFNVLNVLNALKDQDTNCDAAQKDAQGSEAVNEIDESENYELQRGANTTLVKEFKKIVICALGDVIVATTEGGKTVHSLLPLAESDPKAAEETYQNAIKQVIAVVHASTAKIFVAIGDVAYESGNESNQEIKEAISTLENGKVAIIEGVESGGDTLEVGLRYKGDTPSDTLNAVAEIGLFSKMAYIQALVKSTQIVLSVL